MSKDNASFDDLPLTERARDAAHALGWREPTPIQQAVVPQLVQGRDVIGRAQTGSGKTAAFGLVLTDAVRAPGLQSLVLAPTRELVIQIVSDLNALAVGAPFRAIAIHGGVPYDGQIAALRDEATTCAVATTGRLLDLLGRKQIDLTQVRFVVLDEADRMLDLGFLPEVERILTFIPGGRQTALFTATMPKKVAQLAHRYMAHPRDIEVGNASPEEAEHYRVDVPSIHKFKALISLVEKEKPRRALVFVRTRDGADRLARELSEQGVAVVPFHGDLQQSDRDEVMRALRSGEARLVVATDVAARGLDVADITHVINYDVPEEAEQYVHRAGRTARAGRSGRVFTLVAENDGPHIVAAELAARTRLKAFVLDIPLEGGESLTTSDVPLQARPVMRGGYAKGAKRRGKITPPNPMKKLLAPEPEDDGPRKSEFNLPPSRKRKGHDEK